MRKLRRDAHERPARCEGSVAPPADVALNGWVPQRKKYGS
jgi:hypothetical protein